VGIGEVGRFLVRAGGAFGRQPIHLWIHFRR
jgi:hypothetical protein